MVWVKIGPASWSPVVESNLIVIKMFGKYDLWWVDDDDDVPKSLSPGCTDKWTAFREGTVWMLKNQLDDLLEEMS